MREQLYRHTLAALRAQMGLSATQYLNLLDARHRELGYGAMAIRREKVSRWESGITVPEPTAQLAMASLHGIPEDAVCDLGWPDWLLVTFPDDYQVLHAAWTPAGTVAAMAASIRGGSLMDRRQFLIATGTTLTGAASDWAGTLHQVPTRAPATAGCRQLSANVIACLEQRLNDLRHLDDILGGGELRRIATAEFQLVNKLANDTVYDTPTGRRLFTTVSEAARICGWLHFDAGLHAAAQSFYITALRASATAQNRQVGANTLAFMAIQTYSVGNPQDAVNLIHTAQDQTRGQATPRTRSMLHARAARALSKTPHGRRACAHELETARNAYAKGPHDDDPPWTYWITEGEIEMLAGSCALDLGDPHRALHHFTAANHANYADHGYIRDYALFLTRAADAHLTLGDIEQACHIAHQAHQHSNAVDSTRPASALTDFRKRIKPYLRIPAARDFLELTA